MHTLKRVAPSTRSRKFSIEVVTCTPKHYQSRQKMATVQFESEHGPVTGTLPAKELFGLLAKAGMLRVRR